MSCIIHKQEIRMVDPRKFHYIYVLKAGKKMVFEFLHVISKAVSSVRS